jgi:hypothetical protein
MTYHILNGDALVDRFLATGLQGEVVVARECLIEGDLSGDTPDAFYRSRANYLTATYGESVSGYFDRVANEFEKLRKAPDPSEFNLWFGYDLFCRANMWFVLSLLHHMSINKQVYIIYPSHLTAANVWQDFGRATVEDLISCYNNRIEVPDKDLLFANELWNAYKKNDLTKLKELSQQPSACFPYLEERYATGDAKGRPERVIEEILTGSNTEFWHVFKEFFKREGIYGFGDTQVKKIYDRVSQNG